MAPCFYYFLNFEDVPMDLPLDRRDLISISYFIKNVFGSIEWRGRRNYYSEGGDRVYEDGGYLNINNLMLL